MGVNPRAIQYPMMDPYQNPGYIGCYLHNRFGETNAANYPVFEFTPLPPDPITQKDRPLLPLPIGPDGLPRFYDPPSFSHVPKYVAWNNSSTMRNVPKPCTPCPPGSNTPMTNYLEPEPREPVSFYGEQGPPQPLTSSNPCSGVQEQMQLQSRGNEMTVANCVKPWINLTPNIRTMKEHLGKYKYRHKKSGFAGHFPNTHCILGGSVYRLTPF